VHPAACRSILPHDPDEVRKTRADEKLGSIDMNWLKPAIDSEIRLARFVVVLNALVLREFATCFST
jgi:hypothetical protein